jgi:hypothetical protein
MVTLERYRQQCNSLQRELADKQAEFSEQGDMFGRRKMELEVEAAAMTKTNRVSWRKAEIS